MAQRAKSGKVFQLYTLPAQDSKGKVAYHNAAKVTSNNLATLHRMVRFTNIQKHATVVFLAFLTLICFFISVSCHSLVLSASWIVFSMMALR